VRPAEVHGRLAVMDPRRIASTAAVVGSVGWLTKVGLVWANGVEGNDPGLVAALDAAGFVGLGLALAAAGYTLVEKAPGWLRALVTVATPVLALMVWVLGDQAVRGLYTDDTWVRDELSVVAAALVALVLGLWGFRRRRRDDSTRAVTPAHGRRAAR
jgi:hypothetical protein